MNRTVICKGKCKNHLWP